MLPNNDARNDPAEREKGLALSLRQRAERQLESDLGGTGDASPLAPEAKDHLLHELRVHQIELEMQNEELRRTQLELEASHARYFDLYELAPVGYLTLSEQGLVLEANLTAATLLGAARGGLIRRPLTRFVLPEDADLYHRHRKRLFETREPQVCELRMVRQDAAPLWVRLDANVAEDEAGGAPTCRVTMSDITARKQVEAVREQLIQELREAMGNVKKLSGLLPICSGCKRIRDPQGQWHSVDSYIKAHSEASFTHGYCPECIQKYFPGIDVEKE